MKKLKRKLEKLNLNFKKEIGIFCGVNLIILIFSIVLFIFMKNYMLLIVGLIGIFIFSLIYYKRYDNLLEKQKDNAIRDFIDFFSSLRIYLENKVNVYTALNNCRTFSSSDMNKKIENLIYEIDNDKTIVPFMHFAENYENKMIREVMMALYGINQEGYSSPQLDRFITIFEEFKRQQDLIEKDKRYKAFDYFSLFSLLASGLLMIVLVIGVMNLIGDISVNGF